MEITEHCASSNRTTAVTITNKKGVACVEFFMSPAIIICEWVCRDKLRCSREMTVDE